jgi:hypothetical protein
MRMALHPIIERHQSRLFQWRRVAGRFTAIRRTPAIVCAALCRGLWNLVVLGQVMTIALMAGQASADSKGDRPMSDQWDYQIRVYLGDEFAEAARRAPDGPALKPLTDVLARHRATMKCQFDAFADYVAEAERQGTEGFPLYAWTKATIEDPAKEAKYSKVFTIYVEGNEVYAKKTADALESDLRPLVGGALITRMSKHDTNPANNPQMPERFRK